MTKAEKVLRFIGESKDGRKFSEIQRFICEMNGLNYDETVLAPEWMRSKLTIRRLKKYRGYWCTYLLGYAYCSHPGLLYTFCIKKPDGRWILTEKIEGPWTCKQTKTLTWNENRSRADYLLRQKQKRIKNYAI